MEDFQLEGDEDFENDLTIGDVERLQDAVVVATDWTTETILSQMDKGNILLNPAFQRRDAWKVKRKSEFIESLFLGLPIPQIVLAEEKGKRGSYIVLDGKQRLLTLGQFGGIALSEGQNPLALKGLTVKTTLNGHTLEEMRRDPSFRGDVRTFENQTIRTVVLKNWPNEDFLYMVFHRLNTGSLPLSPQELRQVIHPGPFLDFVFQASSDSPGLLKLFGEDGRPDFRMRDVELLIRFYAFNLFIEEYNGNLKRFLDFTCEQLNQKWKMDSNALRMLAHECDRVIEGTFEIFGEDHAFRKWNGKKFEGQFNRSVFDAMSFYFRDGELIENAIANKSSVKECFIKLCDSSSEFRRSIETTTKSISATYARLRLWGEVLNSVLDCEVRLPSLVGNQILR